MTIREHVVPSITLRFALLAIGAALLLALNAYLFVLTDWAMLRGGAGADWTIFGEAGHRILSGGELYAVEENYAYRYSPIVAYVFAALSVIGPVAWRLLHFAALGTLIWLDWRVAVAAVIAWPFWFDVEAGNLVTFTFVLAAWALAGHPWAIGTFLALALLVPRPLVLPILVWLLWKHPEWRIPFGGLLLVSSVIVALTGWGPAWIAALLASTAESSSALNFGPSRLIGVAWIPIGLTLAAVLTLRGRLGLACLAASPYWLPYYFLMPILDLRQREGRPLLDRRQFGGAAQSKAVKGESRHDPQGRESVHDTTAKSDR